MEAEIQHQMVVEKTFPSGAQEWYCPTCGRRFILQWPPNYERIILNEGDETAVHTGGSGGVSMGAPEIQMDRQDMEDNGENNTGSLEDLGGSQDLNDPYLSPFARWMDDRKE